MSTIDHEGKIACENSRSASPRRSADKDHVSSQAGKLMLVEGASGDHLDGDPLIFWTIHPTKPRLVNLTEFAEGDASSDDKPGVGFNGRRQLIEQLAPAFKVRHAMAAPRSIDTVTGGLRKWWRLFDAIEAEERAGRTPDAFAKQLSSVLDLGPLHGSRAVQSGMSKNNFHSFVVLADITRLALGEKRPLYWPSPAKVRRELAFVLPPDEIKALYHGIKADWQSALDRWALGDGLVAGPSQGGFLPGESPVATYYRNNYERSVDQQGGDQIARAQGRLNDQRKHEKKLFDGLSLWQAAAARVGHQDLYRQDLTDSSGLTFYPENFFGISSIAESIYPNGQDARSAFHLCLAVGGLNVSVLTQMRLEFDAAIELPGNIFGPHSDEVARREWVLKRCPFLVQSPVDGEYYLEAWKDRAKSWVSRSYKWKQHLTPGPILVELIVRTWPLRMALVQQLAAAKQDLENARQERLANDTLNALQQRIHELDDGVHSAWVYRGYRGITWLNDADYAAAQPSVTYLQTVTSRLNKDRRVRGLHEIGDMEPRRFRDAYAAWALQYSGGEVLAVMVALDHKFLSTTDGYLENTAVRARVTKKYRSFVQALFTSLGSGLVDPTLIAMETRFADKDQAERSRMATRLVEYRDAVKSRYGVGCRNPHQPSNLADPAFRADGVRTCTTHRCTLCFENAIITPDSFPGLMLRQAELEIMEERTPIGSFKFSSLDAELQNTRTALLPLQESEPERLTSTVEGIKNEIREGSRRLPGFSIRANQA